MGDAFCLKLDQLDSNLSKYFKDLREEQIGFDVTLACDDYLRINAHKSVLAAGSDFFNKLFKNLQDSRPIVFLKGMKMKQLEFIVQFLYNGEVNIYNEDLKNFIEAAKDVQVRGLQSIDNIQEAEENKDETDDSMEPIVKLAVPTEDDPPKESIDDVATELKGTTKDEPEDSEDHKLAEESDSLCTDIDPDILDKRIDEMVEKVPGGWNCKICAKICKGRKNIYNHAETHLADVRPGCNLCGKTMSTRASLRVHIDTVHSNEVFDCEVCNRFGMNKVSYKNHRLKCPLKLSASVQKD